MYTGIVKAISTVHSLKHLNGLLRITFRCEDKIVDGLEIGASVAIDGVCLSVVNIEDNKVSFDVMQESLNKTTLGGLAMGSKVNVERSARQGDEIGGHVLSGHVEGKSTIVDIEKSENNHIITFSHPEEWGEFIFHKGYIAINGASLTIVKEKKGNEFSIFFIPETLRATTFIEKKVGDKVNIEVDYNTKIIVNTVKRYMESREND